MQRFSASIAVDPGGYLWSNHGGYGPEDGFDNYAAGLYLEPASLKSIQESWRRRGEAKLEGDTYDPFIAEPALYRLFATLEPSPDVIRAFANRYGDISTLPQLIDDEPCTLWDWNETIKEMKALVDEADKLLAPVRRSRRSPSNESKVVDFVNELISSVTVSFQATERLGIVSFWTMAFNLLDAMKLQLADAVVERKAYRNCEQCGKPYEVSPQFNRSDRIYCSDNCRVKAYQRRRKQAIKMRADGDTLREIAKTLGSDVPTVKKWVGETIKEK